jgi:hypothetical protein
VTSPAFLSPASAAPEVRLVSPLARALERANGVRDASDLGKLELRGAIEEVEPRDGVELVPITPRRALLLCPARDTPALIAELRPQLRVYDMTGALAGVEFEGERLLRRLTDLDPEALPAVGPVARGVPALVQRRDGERFRLFVPQELGHYVAEVILDLQQGLDA